MKKILFPILAMALIVSCSKEKTEPTPTPDPTPDPVVVDTIPVSTQPAKRVAVIEEYTGINCGYCPDGHRIVNELIAQYPGKVFGVNIHQGGYASNTYTTTEGNAYAGEASISGYPAGCINRHVFAGSTMALGRGAFANMTNQIMGKDSPVNINATAEIEQSTRTLKVKVRGYFTAEQTVSSNSLYVFLLQDSVMGSQSDYGSPSYNPDQWVGDQYRHMHMLRTCISGTWGETVSPLTAGTYFQKEYTYTIPEKIGSPKAIDAVLKDLKVLVFIAEGHKEILTACEPTMVLK